MEQRVAEFAALVDRPGRFGGDVAGDSVGPGELPEEQAHAFGIPADVRIELGVGAIQIGGGDEAWAAVTGADDVHHVQIARDDDAIAVRVDEVQAGGGAPVAEEPGLDVFER